MENFIVSALKYRPQAFDEVVGQQHVTNTLQNAIRQNHLAQALLFTGPRGVGKTTCARILAKLINTTDQGDDNLDTSFNIFELDAASNNTVDDIRNLIDQVRFAPQVGNYKVYIIDEVHMLSQAAFNAFLKTLEEPPKHAIFILATTEKHKIIPTILSRCQIFDFKRITVEDIAQHLAKVAQNENIEAEPEALHIIAQKADGALRDALSIFDRIVSFSNEKVTYKDVIENLRILDYDYYFRTTDAILNNNNAGILLLFNEILELGFDGHLFISGLSSHFRDLLVCKDSRTLDLLEVAESTKTRYKEQSQKADAVFLLKALKLASECDARYKGSNNPRLLVELCMLQMVSLLYGAEIEKKKPNPQLEKEVITQHKATTSPQEKVVAQSNITAEEKPAYKEVPPTHSISSKEVEAPTSAPKKTTAKKPKKNSFSINAVLQGNAPKDEDNVTEDTDELPSGDGLPKDSFTENQLLNLWQEYLEILRKQQKQKVFGSLNNKTLKLKENNIIEIELENEIQASFFQEEKRDLSIFLRDKLNNFSLVLEVKIIASTKTLEPYSPDEKFQYLAEKNPHIVELRKKLNLDLL